MSKKMCGNCKFYFAEEEVTRARIDDSEIHPKDYSSECRRFPPVRGDEDFYGKMEDLNLLHEGYTYPAVNCISWCGEWKRAKCDVNHQSAKQIEFHSKLEMWHGWKDPKPHGWEDRKPRALNFIEEVKLRGRHICLDLIDNDGDQTTFVISLAELAAELVKRHGETVKYGDPEYAKESKAKVLKALRETIAAIEEQTSTMVAANVKAPAK